MKTEKFIHIFWRTYFMVFACLLFLSSLFTSCDEKDTFVPEPIPVETDLTENLIVCNEGIWQSDNGQLSFLDATTGLLTNQWFRQVNGAKLGDTPNDIIQINDTLIAIALNWSNIIQYIHPDGRACGATENVPNNRRLCSDGKYLYVTSYAHKSGTETFQKGYVAKIDLQTKKVIATCETGWEPESIRLYKGKLYIANTGGYSFSEDHDYETTLHVIDAEKMQPIDIIDLGNINLYGEMSQAGRYLCINSSGDYYDNAGHTIIFDCETNSFSVLDFPSTCNTSDENFFYTVGAEFSYLTNEFAFHIHTINPKTLEMSDIIYNNEITEKIKTLESPAALYISPYTGNIYFTDTKNNVTAGMLYGFNKEGGAVFSPQKTYICPTHIIAIQPIKQ